MTKNQTASLEADIRILRYGWGFKTAGIVMGVLVAGSIGLMLSGLLLASPPHQVPGLLLAVVTLVAVICLIYCKNFFNFFINKITIDTRQKRLLLNRTFGSRPVPFADIQDCKLVLVYVPWVLLSFIKWYPLARRVGFTAYLELTTATGAQSVVRYPLPYLNSKATQATETYYAAVFQPLFGDKFHHTRIELAFYVTPLLKKAYWKYALATYLL